MLLIIKIIALVALVAFAGAEGKRVSNHPDGTQEGPFQAKLAELESTHYRKGPACLFCKTMVEEIFKYLKDNRTEENIRQGLDNICSLIFNEGPKREECDDYVDAYANQLIQLLTDETSPEVICMMMDLCVYQPDNVPAPKVIAHTKSITISDFITMLEPGVPPRSLRTCFECKLFIKYLQDTLQDPKSQEHTRKWLLTNLCDTFEDAELKDSCTNLVNDYSDTFFKAIAEQLQPEHTCFELQACKHEQPRRQLLDLAKQLGSASISTVNREENKDVIQDDQSAGSFLNLLFKTEPKNELCDECVDIVTAVDEYLSKNPVERDVSVIIDQVCKKLPPGIGQDCSDLMHQFGALIVRAVSSLQDPQKFCKQLPICLY